MRSKQQPRPSYRWLNKDENDETDEIVHHDVPEQKDILVASGSASPSSSSPLQQNSRETTPTGGLDTIPPLLSAQAAAAVAAVAMLRDRDTQSLSSSHSSPPSIQHTAQLHHQRLLPPYLIDANQDDGEHKLPVALLHNTIDPTDDRGAINNLTAAVALSTAANNMKREMVSPRCNSRDSSIGRCPSDDSTYSGRNSVHNTNAPSPVSVALPPTLSPTAAAALLPSQSAAMAAYLNVAAAAAQQNRLLLGTGLAKSNSPPLGSPSDGDTPVLDFSTKRRPDLDDNTSDSDVINLSKPDNGPLDLSVSRKRSSNVSPPPPPNRKMSRSMDYKPNLSPWMTPMNPYFAAAAAAAAGLSPKSQTNEWNGVGKKLAPSDATKALEKMSELSRLGGVNEITNRSTSNNSSSSGSRHSAWQSHWLNKGADAAKDVFKCVWSYYELSNRWKNQ